MRRGSSGCRRSAILVASMEDFSMHYKLPLVFEPQPEGGYTVTSPLLPELVTEGDTVEDALENVRDALAAVLELYQELGRKLPPNLVVSEQGTVCAEMVVAIP
jgi:antitoxin HicB